MGGESSKATQSIRKGIISQYPDLDSDHEEVDIPIIPRALHAVRSSCKRVVILSSDTDVFIFAMHFYDIFAVNGLEQ